MNRGRHVDPASGTFGPAALAVLGAAAVLALWWGFVRSLSADCAFDARERALLLAGCAMNALLLACLVFVTSARAAHERRLAARVERSREELRGLSVNLQRVHEREKSRVARELHEDLGQALSALKMDLAVLETEFTARAVLSHDVATQTERMRRLIDDTIASLRRIAAHQRPAMLDDLGLLAAIEWLVDDFMQRYGIDVERNLETGDLTFSADAATAAFRIIEEALSNVALHADATRVRLSLVADRQNCVLRVADNGIGARALSAPTGHAFGLIGVRERAGSLGGRVHIDAVPENGFVLTVVLPRESVRQKESHS
jgi:signal transduction histidine kinase